MDGSVSVQDIMDYLSISDKTVYARLKKMGGEFVLRKGRIYQADDPTVTSDPHEAVTCAKNKVCIRCRKAVCGIINYACVT